MDPTDGEEAAYMRFEPALPPARVIAMAMRADPNASIRVVSMLEAWLESDKQAQFAADANATQLVEIARCYRVDIAFHCREAAKIRYAPADTDDDGPPF